MTGNDGKLLDRDGMRIEKVTLANGNNHNILWAYMENVPLQQLQA